MAASTTHPPVTATKFVYDFAEGSREMRELLGGKGANIAEMTRVLGADLVPAGFTITTEACVAFMRAGASSRPGSRSRSPTASRGSRRSAGRRLGDPDDPLLVSVRSGARDSMPGMLDTILDLGLNDASVDGPRRAHRQRALRVGLLPALRADVRQRRARRSRRALRGRARARSAGARRPLDTRARRRRAARARRARFQTSSTTFPQDPREQLRRAVRAVFDSWLGDRAVAYRRINHIPDDWGTAVNVQQMVFGNTGASSATGVAFSRDEMTGAPEPSGDFLLDAQGEDVVSGVRTPRDLHELADWMPDGARRAAARSCARSSATTATCRTPSSRSRSGRLYMLQTRSAKRPAQAAVRFAVDAVDEGLLTREQALATIDAGALDALLHPTFDPDARLDVLARGVAASPGAAKGEIVFTAEEAVAAARGRARRDPRAAVHRGRRRRRASTPREGILTSRGRQGLARGARRPRHGPPGRRRRRRRSTSTCARARSASRRRRAAGRRPDRDRRQHRRGHARRRAARRGPRADERFERVLGVGDELRRLGVRANADTPADAREGARVRRRGHRPVPDRAHVHGRRPPAEDAAR